ncbi:hypothetical protein V2J09_024328, partial [Rumex salicifolius]
PSKIIVPHRRKTTTNGWKRKPYNWSEKHYQALPLSSLSLRICSFSSGGRSERSHFSFILPDMGRGVSSGGGQSSLDYLFGGGEVPKPAASNASSAAPTEVPVNDARVAKPITDSQPMNAPKHNPAGGNRSATNNYLRADGQNCGNFITDRPSTKVQAAPGGQSSLDYLFGGGSK